MNFVLDASVAAKYLVPEADSDKARDLMTHWEQGRVALRAPAILMAEVGNMLWKRAVRGLIPAEDAASLLKGFVQIRLPLAPIENLANSALKLALRYHHSVYDGLYVALALAAQYDFITADERLFKTLSPFFPQVRLLRNWG